MDTKRLQEIEGKWATPEVVDELITAIKQAWALSDKLGVSCTKLLHKNDVLRKQLVENDVLRNQLAEANDLYEIADEGMINCSKQLAEAKCDVLNLQNDASHFNADNKHAHEYIERLKIENASLRTENKAIEEHIAEHGVY